MHYQTMNILKSPTKISKAYGFSTLIEQKERPITKGIHTKSMPGIFCNDIILNN